MSALLPEGLLEIMQCPACGGSLHEEHEPASLLCEQCSRRYPVRDGIPVMLLDQATIDDPPNPAE